MNWKVILEKDKESGLFTISVPALPGCISQGKTRKEALKNIKEAIELHLESIAQDDGTIKGRKKVATVAVTI